MKLLEVISEGLQLPRTTVVGLAAKATHAYKTYTIPKKSRGVRVIHHPSKKLKTLQRWLLQNVINQWPSHEAAYAYRTGRGIASHARVHAGSSFLLRMDFVDFFPSITSEDIDLFLRTKPFGTSDWDPVDRQLFKALVCRSGKLTIGAPSSPAISNAVCSSLDASLAGLSTREGVRYTRYADDLFFSTTRPGILSPLAQKVEDLVGKAIMPAGLRVNREKTRHSSKRGRRQVTGLVLTSEGSISIGRDRKRYIRRQIYRYEELTFAERQELAGLLAFSMSIEPDIINSLILKYGRERVLAVRDAAND